MSGVTTLSGAQPWHPQRRCICPTHGWALSCGLSLAPTIILMLWSEKVQHEGEERCSLIMNNIGIHSGFLTKTTHRSICYRCLDLVSFASCIKVKSELLSHLQNVNIHTEQHKMAVLIGVWICQDYTTVKWHSYRNWPAITCGQDACFLLLLFFIIDVNFPSLFYFYLCKDIFYCW